MIQIENLSFHYRKSKPVFSNVSTELSPGRIYGLLGLNGEGKTSLLKLLSGLLFPKEGTILVDGLPSTSRNEAFLKKLYMLSDQPASSALTIGEYVRIYSVFFGDFSHDFLDEALQQFNLQKSEYIRSLSLGQQKKFHLAFALATNTKILLLDEPTNGLDIPSKSIVRKLLVTAAAADKIILISTHLIKDVENLIDHLLIIKDSNLAFDMSLEETLRRYTFVQTGTALQNAIYKEQSLSTYRCLVENTNQVESNIDIELLFNAVQQAKI